MWRGLGGGKGGGEGGWRVGGWSTKEYYRSERRVNKLLSTMHINLITMTDPV